jgi:hypothetical protein
VTMKRYFSCGKRRGKWLVVLGAALTVFSLAALMRIPGLAQFIAPAPAEQTAQEPDGGEGEAEPAAPSALRSLVDSWENNRSELGGAASGMSAVMYGATLDSSAAQTDSATVTCVGDGWFDVYPRFLTEGRLFSGDEQEVGRQVVVLDEQLAFKLFPTTAPTQGRVMLDGQWYEVIGVVRHRRGAGDSDKYGAYIPLMTAARLGLQTEFVQLSCSASSMGAVRALESVADTVMEGGSFYYTHKEVMRVTMILRILGVLLGMYMLGFALRMWNRRTVELVRGWQQEVLRHYFKKMLPSVVGWSLLQLAGYALLALAAFGVLRLTISPMYMFTEWVPEVIVEWSKIMDRFEGLITAAAAPVRYQTREYAAIRFYGALLRWGVICLLSGAMLFKRWDFKWLKVKNKKA